MKTTIRWKGDPHITEFCFTLFLSLGSTHHWPDLLLLSPYIPDATFAMGNLMSDPHIFCLLFCLLWSYGIPVGKLFPIHCQNLTQNDTHLEFHLFFKDFKTTFIERMHQFFLCNLICMHHTISWKVSPLSWDFHFLSFNWIWKLFENKHNGIFCIFVTSTPSRGISKHFLQRTR